MSEPVVIEEEQGQCIGAPRSNVRRFVLREFGGWFFPDHEAHLQDWLRKVNDERDGRLRYQGAKQDLALAHCRQKRVAIDIGTGRVFRRRRDAQPERVAAESLDGGLVYLCAWGEP